MKSLLCARQCEAPDQTDQVPDLSLNSRGRGRKKTQENYQIIACYKEKMKCLDCVFKEGLLNDI